MLALTMIGAAGAVTAFAAPEDNANNYEYIFGYNENNDEAENSGDLPEADEDRVVEATTVPMPEVDVTDATLFSGIVMWLCVALGIAVLVGVLVSKRTRRRR